jgi:hypothetical protein
MNSLWRKPEALWPQAPAYPIFAYRFSRLLRYAVGLHAATHHRR